MLTFYLFSGALIVFALLLLAYPLLRNDGTRIISEHAERIRSELRSLESLRDQGVLANDAFDTARVALLEKLLLTAPDQPIKSRTGFNIAIAMMALLPLVVMGLYKAIGTPSGQSFNPVPLAQQGGSSAPADSQASTNATQPGEQAGPDLNKAAEGLKARLAADPADGEGWQLLGRTYLELGNYQEAADALQQAAKILPASAELYAQVGHALGMAQRPNPAGKDAMEAVDQALKLDANSIDALWLKGMFLVQQGDLENARINWEKLLGLISPEDPFTARIQEAVDKVRGELKLPPLAANGNAVEPPALDIKPVGADATLAPVVPVDEPAVAAGAGVTVRVTISDALREKIGANDVLYIYAKAENGPPMPLAIHRGPAAELKSGAVTVSLDDSSAMMPEMKLSQFPNIVVGARVSKSGLANSAPGDFQTLSAGMKQPVTSEVALNIDAVL
jgi:cytochrome c-type biogenesis protein CcmH